MQASTATKENREEVDYLCVLDFEATCNNTKQRLKPQEIIEFPTILVNARTGEVESTFHHYIRPDVNPQLSAFCTELTGITQETIDEKGISLQEALLLHQNWLEQHNLTAWRPDINQRHKKTFLYLTCGDWDLKTCLPKQLLYHGQQVPSSFGAWINVKESFLQHCGVKALGMTAMLDHLRLELVGRHHSGIDDCRNIARIVQRLLETGWTPTATTFNRAVGGDSLGDPNRLIPGMAAASAPSGGKPKSQKKREKLGKAKAEQKNVEMKEPEQNKVEMEEPTAPMDPEKRARKLKKVLRQIEDLKQKSDLNEEQKAKLATESEVRTELEQLGY